MAPDFGMSYPAARPQPRVRLGPFVQSRLSDFYHPLNIDDAAAAAAAAALCCAVVKNMTVSNPREVDRKKTCSNLGSISLALDLKKFSSNGC